MAKKNKKKEEIWYQSPYIVDLRKVELKEQQTLSFARYRGKNWRGITKTITKTELAPVIKSDTPKFNFVRPAAHSRWHKGGEWWQKRLAELKSNPLISHYFDQLHSLSFLKLLGFFISRIYLAIYCISVRIFKLSRYTLAHIKFILRIIWLYWPSFEGFTPALVPLSGTVRGSALSRSTFLARFSFEPQSGWVGALVSFVVIALLLVFPIGAFTYYQGLQETKTRITSDAFGALGHLRLAQDAADVLDLESAVEEFKEANQNFILAEGELNRINIVVSGLAQLIPSQRSGKLLLGVGKELSEAAGYLTQGAKVFLTQEIPLTNKIVVLETNLKPAYQKIEAANRQLAKIDFESIPPEYQDSFQKISAALPYLEKNLQRFISLSEPLLEILGHQQFKRYLVIFQNNNELRATGGFMGSYALIDVDRGRIKNIEIPGGGSYDLQGSLTAKVIAPQPLHLINPVWEFQDANWWPDFPVSAQKIIWFYEKAGEPTVDGVIAINASLMEDLLRITGPIVMDEYDKVIDSQNFTTETTQAVELDYDKQENRPKKFLADLAPKVLARVLDTDFGQSLEFLESFLKALNGKDILLYFAKPELEKMMIDFGWGGEVRQTTGDYLMVVNTNIGGQKTDAVIKEDIEHQTEIGEDGTITDTLIITRTHKGKRGELFTGVNNVNYLRVYVSGASELLEASGFNPPKTELFETPPEGYQIDEALKKGSTGALGVESYNEFGKTVFAGWTQTEPGATTVIKLKYRLSSKLNFGDNLVPYSLLVQKQSGSRQTMLKHSLIIPDNWQSVRQYGAELEAKLDSDKFFTATFEVI